jgi:hypothetical protein
LNDFKANQKNINFKIKKQNTTAKKKVTAISRNRLFGSAFLAKCSSFSIIQGVGYYYFYDAFFAKGSRVV